MEKFERPTISFDLSHQYNSAKSIMDSMEQNRALQIKHEENEEEKREYLRNISDNSGETLNVLKEMNEILKKQNQLLEQENGQLNSQLKEIVEVITLLVNVTKDASSTMDDDMKQANALALQLCVTSEENEKFDWKTFLANTSINGVMLGLQIFLHQHGLL